jgi:L-seryl-tRNA(Ser) seleniumtransferase
VLFCAGAHLERNSLPLPFVIERAHARGIPVIVDAAAQVPPVSNLWHFTRELGADVAIFSGGKNISGPQNSGLCVGTEPFIRAMRACGPPIQRFGRTLKVGKETMIGLLRAVERFVALDHEAEAERWSAVCDLWMDAWTGTGMVERWETNEAGEPIPRVIMSFPSREERDGAYSALKFGSPPIDTVLHGSNGLAFSPHMLQPGEAEIVASVVPANLGISVQI